MADSTSRLSYRLSPSQTRNLLEDALSGSDWGLNVEQVVCRSTEALDMSAFKQSWQTIIDHHSALRVGFKRDDQQQPCQEIHLPVELPVIVEDLQQIKPSEREAFIEEWLEHDRKKNFDLSAPPLMRITVIRFADNSVTWVWTFHHILMDGRSFLLVLEDFFASYESSCAKREVALPERKHFAEFISWHQSWLESHRQSAGSFWRELFAKDEADSILSISRTSTQGDHRQEKIKLKIEAATTESLHRLARDFDLTVNTIIQGTWALLVSRYYRSKSVTFATIRACRGGSVDGTDGMIGMLMNFLPVHVRISDSTSVVDFLKGVREQQMAVRSHQWSSWDMIWNSIPAAASKQLFDSCVLYERYNIAQEMTERFGKNGARTFSLRERSNMPLLLSVSERPQFQFELIYQSRLFEAEDINQLGRSFLALLHHLLKTPTKPVGALELLDSADKANVIKKLSGPEVIVPEDKALHHWFEDQVKRTPDALAVVAECTLTYQELDRQANDLAERLVAMGAAPDQVVAIYLPRSANVLIAILGVLKSGAAYLPITVMIPKARIKGLLADANACAVITDEEQSRTLPVLTIPLVRLDGNQVDLPLSSKQTLPKVCGSHLAYVMPTSGTTGRPKLICVEHRQTANLLAYARQSLLQPDDVRYVPFIDAPGFDSSISQIFTTLALGGTLVQIPEILEISKSPYYEKFTCLGSTPSLLATVLKVIGLPPSVRLIGLGAEAIPADLLEKLEDMPQVRKVINYYGPSEATVYCTVALALDRSNPNDRVDLRNRGRVIGRAIANTRIYLVDEFGQLTPPGAPGEIYIAGAPVARGYLGLAGKDSDNFLPDHFAAKPGGRMYRSGDIACLRTEGQLEFHGRKDHQLKFHGVRIEAAEIENALLSFPGIRQAVVNLRSEEDGKKRLVGYLAVEDANFQKQKLRKVLRLLLPGAMIPQHFVVLSDLPLTSNGKVDREALSRLELGIETSATPSAPATPMENQMKEIWEQNLSRSPIGLDQDYFEMGGDSLSAVNLLLAIEKQFGIRLKPQILPEHSTISELVREVEASLDAAVLPRQGKQASLVSLQGSGNQTPLVLIPGGSGEGFLSYKNFAQNFFPDHPVYAVHSPYALMIEEPADPIATLSTHFAQQIASLLKDRPFVLFGHCVGGLLAWHIARALKKEKTQNFKLVLYDAPVPRRGINVTSLMRESRAQSRFQRSAKAYLLAWDDWRTKHGDDLWTKVRFLLWAVNNVFMRKGLDRSERGRDNFAKLAYLRMLQTCPLDTSTHDALLIYHRYQAEALSRSLWHTHSTGEIKFEFIPGDHTNWENFIVNTIPLVRHQLQTLAANQPPPVKNAGAPTASATV